MKKNTELVIATPTMLDMQKLATDGQPFATPGTMANMLGLAVDTIVARLTEAPTLGGRVYARKNELAVRYAISANTITDWLNTLEKEGKIHPLQGAPGNGSSGDTLYKIREIDAALQERRRTYLDRKEKAKKK